MLIKLLSYDFTTTGSYKLNAILLDNDNTTAINTTTPPDKALFRLERFLSITPATITITSIAAGTTPASGEIVITFDESAVSDQSTNGNIKIGDVLVLSQGTTVGTTPYSRIMNTASMDTGLGTTPLTEVDQYTVTPSPNSTKDKNYSYGLSFFQEGGTEVVIPLNQILGGPITIAGETINSIRFSMITDPNLTTKYSNGLPVQFKALFYTSTDGSGTPLTLEGNANDIFSMAFIPAQ